MTRALLMSAAVTLALASGCGSIHDAAAGGDIETVRWHLQRGTDINVRTPFGATPLHMAAREGRV